MLIIMLSGKAGTGKNTVADILETLFDIHNLDCHQFAFGDRVKETAKFMGWSGVKDELGRKLLQTIGNGGRAYDIDVWAKKTVKGIQLVKGYNKDALGIITDLRYTSELRYIADEFEKDVIIPARINGVTSLTGEAASDIGEVNLDNYNFPVYVDNHKGLVELKNEIIKLLQHCIETIAKDGDLCATI